MSLQPQTPQSPNQSSPSSLQHLATSGSTTSFSSTASGNAAAAPSTQTTHSTLPTPAHSVNGNGLGALETTADMSVLMTDDLPHKRKREPDDTGSQQPKKVNMGGQQGMDFEALHQDVGEKYFVCKKSHTPAFPPLTVDLYDMFNLNGLAAEVARTLPNGEKNAMRKTYKGYMKKLGVAGHFEPQKREPGDESDFMLLLDEPEDSWQARHGRVGNIRSGFASDIQASLRAALTMNKGPLPKAVWDNSVLGSDAPSLAVAAKSVRGSSSTPLLANTSTGWSAKIHHELFSSLASPMGSATGSPSASPAVGDTRPRRLNKKRSYNDDSFEGYHEAFEEDGYSTGADVDGHNSKRRKTGTPTSQFAPAPAPVRQQSYGPGMVGA